MGIHSGFHPTRRGLIEPPPRRNNQTNKGQRDPARAGAYDHGEDPWPAHMPPPHGDDGARWSNTLGRRPEAAAIYPPPRLFYLSDPSDYKSNRPSSHLPPLTNKSSPYPNVLPHIKSSRTHVESTCSSSYSNLSNLPIRLASPIQYLFLHTTH